jgi:transposase
LVLCCTVEARLWTAEGTEQVRQEKVAEVIKVLTSMAAKTHLRKTQQGFVRRKESSLQRFQQPYPRPSRPLYQGKPEVLIGVSLGLEKPVTVAVVNISTNKVLAYRSSKQLLGKHDALLHKFRKEQQRQAHQGHRQRLKGIVQPAKESQLGQYLDRLFARAIVQVAQHYQAGSIVLPNLTNIREVLDAEVQQRAEQKVPDYLEAQQRYAKAYRSQVHRWRYHSLSQSISSKADEAGISIEFAKQELAGTPAEKARALAFQGYSNRQYLN